MSDSEVFNFLLLGSFKLDSELDLSWLWSPVFCCSLDVWGGWWWPLFSESCNASKSFNLMSSRVFPLETPGLSPINKKFSEFWSNSQISESFHRFSNCVLIQIFWGKFSEICTVKLHQNILPGNFSDFLKKFRGSKFSYSWQEIYQKSVFCW